MIDRAFRRHAAIRRDASAGFTLIELMIVVAVVAIILAIGIPSYNEQVRKTRRAAATGELASIAQNLERFHTVNNTFVGAPCAQNTDFYAITCPTLTRQTYQLNAAPTAGQTGDKCGTLTLTHTGARGVTGAASGVTAQDCW